MRISIIVGALLLTSVAHADGKRLLVKSAAPETENRALQASEIQHHMKQVNHEIGRCYLDASGDIRGAGQLEIKLAIHRTGLLDSVEVSTPKLPQAVAKKVDSCVRALVSDLTFPVRRVPTTAIIPYFYQRTAAPGSGPQLSCWNAKGCR